MAVFNLWREYPTQPYQRWACSIAEDETTPAGYRITAHDETVADPGFLHALTEHLGSPVTGMTQVPLPGGEGHVDQLVALMPGEHRHIATAVRQFPQALLGGAR